MNFTTTNLIKSKLLSGAAEIYIFSDHNVPVVTDSRQQYKNKPIQSSMFDWWKKRGYVPRGRAWASKSLLGTLCFRGRLSCRGQPPSHSRPKDKCPPAESSVYGRKKGGKEPEKITMLQSRYLFSFDFHIINVKWLFLSNSVWSWVKVGKKHIFILPSSIWSC